jgi:hypothetical protein
VPTSRSSASRRWLRALFFALLVAVAGAVQMGAASVDIGQESRVWWWLPVFAVSALIGLGAAWLLRVSFARRIPLVIAFGVVAVFATFDGAASPAAAVLAFRGEETRVTVVELRVNRGRRGENVNYRVAGPGGKRIPGEWTDGRTFREPGMYRTKADYDRDTWSPQKKDELVPIGATVTLVVDPQGEVHPHTPEEVGASGERWSVWTVIGLVALVLASIGSGPLIVPPANPTPVQAARMKRVAAARRQARW